MKETPKKIQFQGREVEAIEIEVVRANESWTEVQLADGNVLMFKDVIVSIDKLLNEKNPDGSPIYLFHTHRVMRVKQ